MKKVLLSILIIIMLVVAYTAIVNGLNISAFGFSHRVESFEGIRAANTELDEQFGVASALVNREFPEANNRLNAAIPALRNARAEYIERTSGLGEDAVLGVHQLEMHNLDFLWTVLGNYASRDNVNLTLDLIETPSEDIFQLEYVLIGDYMNVVNFLYNIENDDRLRFRIEVFEVTTVDNFTAGMDPERAQSVMGSFVLEEFSAGSSEEDLLRRILVATFRVSNVGVMLDGR